MLRHRLLSCVRQSLGLICMGLAAVPALAGVPAPDIVPTCPAPQVLSPLQVVGGVTSTNRTQVAWSGREYAVAWAETGAVKLRRYFADGTPAAPAVTLYAGQIYAAAPVALVWNGTGYAAAWSGYATSSYQIFFQLFSALGTPQGSPLQISSVGSPSSSSALNVTLAWSGSGYAAVWDDGRTSGTTGQDIYATLLDSSGAIAGGGTLHDIAICKAEDDQFCPSVVWSSGAGCYQVAWEDYRSGSRFEIWVAQLRTTGSVVSPLGIVSGAGSSFFPVLASNGSGAGLVWYDSRDGNIEVYFTRLAINGAKIGGDVRLTSDANASYMPRVVWTGAEYGVVWYDGRTSTSEIWFQRVSAAGAAVGANLQVTTTGGAETPEIAFAGFGYLITANWPNATNFVQAWGCAADTTPPTCPMDLLAYNVSGTSATVGWIPSVEDATDVAYYEVYRNAALVARTSDALYTDTSLSLGTTYNFYVRPVNAAQLVNGGCSSSIYVKTNATLLLMLDKSQDDAALTWNDASMNHYNVFRGTDPRVMQQIGNTAELRYTDPDVLNDAVLYFYTVDEPGQ